LQDTTNNGLLSKKYEMKVFVQERLPTLILHQNKFKTVIANNSKNIPIFKKLFKDNEKNISLIGICGDLKNIYGKTQDQNILEAYLLIRKSVELNT
jgi:phenylacetate-coenzyme A ligase PaaK-like adenylate-forming protein